jgi:WD40 repeat protein
MYRIAEIIENDGAPSFVGEVSFHPSGSYFAATYESINEVRIFDSRTRRLLQVLENPKSRFDHPHGVLFTEKYLLIANSHGLKRPGTISVYRNGGNIAEPIQVFQSPFDHLREPHSLAVRDRRLVITYCENVAPSGAVVSYGFDEETGEITGPLDKTES